jgi:hypothetical protein
MKYAKHLALVLGLLFLVLALSIMFRQTVGRQELSSEPIYVKDVPKFISVN